MFQIQENISLKDFTTFKVGGEAKYFAVVKNVSDLKETISFIKKEKLPFFVLGGGANILVADNGFDGLVIKNEISSIEILEKNTETILVKVGAGNNWDDFVSFTILENIFGLENLSGIPGTVGGMVVQNAGAYGKEIKDFIVSVEVFNTETDQIEVFSNMQCVFSYRSSVFKDKDSRKYIIISADFILNIVSGVNYDYKDLKNYFTVRNVNEPSPKQVREAVIEIRKGKMPDLSKTGCAGSFFKNLSVDIEKYTELKKSYPDMPGFAEVSGKIKVPLAWILDHVLKLNGYRDGNVGLHDNQPLVLVNYGEATCEDIFNFAKKIKKIVKEKIDVDIEWEVEEIN